MTEKSDDQLMRWMNTLAFKKRAARCRNRIKRRMDAGEPWSFEEIAKDLKLPLQVVVKAFEHSMAKAGMPLGHMETTSARAASPAGTVH